MKAARVFRWLGGSAVAAFAVLSAGACGSEVDVKTGTVMDGVLDIDRAELVDNPDDDNPYCTSSDASSGSRCTRNCLVTCGFRPKNGDKLGTKVCSCIGGAYAQCPCFKPSSYAGAETAPLCDTSDGTTTHIKDTPCDTEWEECIGTDAVTGSTPRGCVCLKNANDDGMEWKCGSTNRWFRLEGT